MRPRSILAVVLCACATFTLKGIAQTPSPPPPPSLVAPTNGASLVQPMALKWSAVVDPDGPIVSYTWQVGTSSAFSVVIASGFTDTRNGDPVPTQASVSGLPNGSYFWRVKATQNVGGATGFLDSAWSAVGTFSITGLGPAPSGTPTITSPGNGSQFHPYEFFNITWTAVPGAQYYVLEADDEPSFSYPLTLSTSPMEFGTAFHAGWGNEIPNIYYRVRAVSVDNVRGLPSATLNVKIVNTAPIPPPPTPQSPVGGATVSLPFTFDWSDTPNPQIPGYDIDVDTDPNFSGTFGVLMVQNVSRSDYMLASDLPPGSYFWRVRAQHGLAYGPWSAGVPFKVVASPPTPPGLNLFWILAEPNSVSGGLSTKARVSLNAPAPAGGVTVNVASDMPHAQVPQSVFIPAGATDATVSPITTIPVGGATIGDIRAAYAGVNWQQSSLGLWPLLFSLALDKDTAVGGNSVTGTITLQRAAPAGGIEVTLVSNDTSLARPPAKVTVPEGATGASFSIPTTAVTSSRQVTINTGTAIDDYRAPEAWLTLVPAGSPAPAPALATVSVPASVLGGHTTTGTVTLTGPAPAGGASVWLNGSMEGQVITPSGGVTVPAGSTSASFTITAPQVDASYWVIVQASYGNSASMHGSVIRIDPSQPAVPDLYAMGVDPPQGVIGGNSLVGTVGLVTPAPVGGTTVFLSSSDASSAQVPASVQIAAGNSTNSFTITTSNVATTTSVQISAQSGSVTKTAWISVGANPNAPAQLSSVTPSVGGTTGGNNISATLFLTANAPAGGANVTLSSSNTAAAKVPATVTVPAGQGFQGFTITTFPVSASTSVTITGTYGVSKTAIITVDPGGGGGGGTTTNTGLLSPSADAADSAGDGNGFEVSATNAYAADGASAVDNNSGTASSTSCTSTARDKHRFFNYGIALPSGATVKGIEVRLDSRVDSTNGSPRMCVELSWDGGTSWTAPLATSTLTTTMATRILGSATNLWGHGWTAADLSNANFRIRVTDVANSTNRDFSLDWIAVRVSY